MCNIVRHFYSQTPFYLLVTFIIDCAMEMQEVVEGECATKIADPTIKGFVFEGWYADSEYTTVYDFSKPKFYALDMFPYPSGVGLHAGHPEGYTATDVVCRMKRMQGFNVLHPMGWDSFGLPAEQYAIKNKVYPANMVKECINTFKSQMMSLGFSFDWDREFSTTDYDIENDVHGKEE